MHIQLTERYPTRAGRRPVILHTDIMLAVVDSPDGGGGSRITLRVGPGGGFVEGTFLEVHEDYDDVAAALRAVGQL